MVPIYSRRSEDQKSFDLRSFIQRLQGKAPHAGNAPTPPVRQTGMLLLQQWGQKMVARRGLEPRCSGWKPNTSPSMLTRHEMVAGRELHSTFRLFRPTLSCVSYPARNWSRRHASHVLTPGSKPGDSTTSSSSRFENWSQRPVLPRGRPLIGRILC